MNLTLGGDVVFSGVKYPFMAGYQQPWTSLVGPALGAIGCRAGVVGVAACAAGALAAPYIIDWLTRSGGRIKPDGTLERQDPNSCSASCFTYSVTSVAPYIGNTRDAGCNLHAAYLQSFGYSTRNFEGRNLDQCYGEYHPAGVTDWTPNTWTMSRVPRPADPESWIPASMDDIAPYMADRIPDSRVVGEILGRGGEIPLGTPTVTGPTTIQGPEKSTTKADGSRVVERTNYNFQTSGNTINNTSNITTYNTYNSGGTLTGTETTTETPTATTPAPGEEIPTQCDKYPNSLGCTELDTPEGEIPKENREITYTAENPFGGGSCPSDRHFFSTMTARSYKAWDFAQTCSYIASYVRPVVLLLATFAAFLILMPGKVET